MSEEREEDGSPSHERWLVSYADFITLLFAFFTVLYATSEKNSQKAQEFQESVKRYLIKAGAPGSGGEVQVNEADKHNRVIEPPIPTFSVANPEDDRFIDQLEQLLEEKFTAPEREGWVLDIAADGMGVRLVLGGRTLFVEDGIQLKTGATSFLDRLAGIMRSLGRRVAIEGHVENKKYRGLDPWDAASLRAGLLARYLNEKSKLPSDSMVVISQGAQRPLSEEKAESGNGNERIEMIFLSDDRDL